jgi:hypothetical protein
MAKKLPEFTVSTASEFRFAVGWVAGDRRRHLWVLKGQIVPTIYCNPVDHNGGRYVTRKLKPEAKCNAPVVAAIVAAMPRLLIEAEALRAADAAREAAEEAKRKREAFVATVAKLSPETAQWAELRLARGCDLEDVQADICRALESLAA